MGVSRQSVLDEGMRIQGVIRDIGAERVPDVSALEITGQQGMIDSLNALLNREGEVQGAFTSATVMTGEDWEELWGLCGSVQDIALSKPGNETGKAAMKKARFAGGCNVTRARKVVRQVLGALKLYSDDFAAKGNTKAALVTRLEAAIDADQFVVDNRSTFQGIQGDIRKAVKDLDTENDRILTIMEATFDVGSPERDQVDRARVRRPAPRKKFTEQPQPNP